MDINIIAAIAKNGAIGLDNNMIYFIKEDLKRFRQLTTGNTVIMGRKTFQSLPKGALPNRRNIVLTHLKNKFEGCDVYNSLDEALKTVEANEKVFIIGGASVYAEALKIANRMYLTEIDDIPSKADVFFPEVNKSDWNIIKKEEHKATDTIPSYSFVNYEKVNKNIR